MRDRKGSIILGLVIIGFGIGVLGKAIGLWELTLFEGWWTMFLIIPGIISIVNDGVKISNTFITMLGVILLLEEQNFLPNVELWALIVGSLIIVVGMKLIFGGNNYKKINVNNHHQRHHHKSHKSSSSSASIDTNDRPSYFAMFSACDMKNISTDLLAGEATTLFGGIDADFSEAIVKRDINISCCAIFGGIDIVAPRGVRVIVKGTPIFGGYDNNSPTVTDNNAPIVTINCFALFGGIEVN
ncbi:MAG: LiaF transmembrane domain-containing protein [Clostridium sp.]